MQKHAALFEYKIIPFNSKIYIKYINDSACLDHRGQDLIFFSQCLFNVPIMVGMRQFLKFRFIKIQ